MKNQKISVALKLIISLLFVTSAMSKLFPIWAFESQLTTLGIANLNMAQYAARLIIGLELSIGLCFLQKKPYQTYNYTRYNRITNYILRTPYIPNDSKWRNGWQLRMLWRVNSHDPFRSFDKKYSNHIYSIYLKQKDTS